ncbi:hypothetical protein [Jiangella asiatica]|uniref:Uncharacterized protein n=1 Tax=Jiangella asiatica TaxID=2530372 RepID=A0A4R5CHF9_9ACTN|nr:hypothetical protein [Jiangella asiatica]TDD97743.1 hypothetical protein E1269_29475 [Jiangella asiatica]
MVRWLVASIAVPGALAMQSALSPGVLTLSVAVASLLALMLALRVATRACVGRAHPGVGTEVGHPTGIETMVIALTDPDAAIRPRPRAPAGLVCIS